MWVEEEGRPSLTDDTQLDPGVARGALVEVHSTPVQTIVRVGGVVYDECRRWTGGCLEVGASPELLLVHPMRTLLKLGVPDIKALGCALKEFAN